MTTTTTTIQVCYLVLLPLLFLLVAHLPGSVHVVEAALACETDADCEAEFGVHSVCLTAEENDTEGTRSRTCSSPFQRGCLQRLGKTAEQRGTIRVCNSDDFAAFEEKVNFTATNTHILWSGHDSETLWELASQRNMLEAERLELKTLLLEHERCELSDFYYPEIRITQADWEASVFLSWIYQILLMEIMGVPITIGLTTGETAANSFYAVENTFPYAPTSGYRYDALDEAVRQQRRYNHHDCLRTQEPCSQLLPDVWATDYTPYVRNNSIEPPMANGQIAKTSLYIPAFTAQQYPDMAIYYGLRGEANRQKLAETFKRPTTWGEYCQEVHDNNCTVYTLETAAVRPPEDDEEAAMYYSEGLYKGYFRATEENNCSGNPNCTGHVVAPPCDWNIFLESQLYWNDIVGLKISGGPDGSGYYDYATIYQVWRAANATRNHVIVGWYQPEVLVDEFSDSEFAFQEVMFPTPTDVCLARRTTPEERCTDDIWVQRGDPLGACDNEAKSLVKLMAESVKEFNMVLEEAEKSPAHDFLKNLVISELEINRIFVRWLSYDKDMYGNDAREAACSWIVDNYEYLVWNIPEGYPRELVGAYGYDAWWLVLAQIFAVYSAFASIILMVLTFYYRETKVMVFAQPEFVFLILVGFLMISVGSCLIAFEPTEVTCVALTWMLTLGYTVELVPVLIKTAAINKLVQSSKKQKRVNISRMRMLLNVVITCSIIIGFLIFWTVYDPIGRTEVRRMVPGEENMVESDLRCTSELPYFRAAAYAWLMMLQLIGAVLAVQSRDVLKDFNESKTLGLMVYSHLMNLILRGVCQILYLSDALPYSLVAALLSYNYTLDAVFAMSVYVLPKFIQARAEPQSYKQSRISSNTSGRASSMPAGEELTVVCCTANIGNAEPTEESMEAWIPSRGKRNEVNPIDDNDYSMRHGVFHLVVIGMQESTWKETSTMNTRKEGEELTQEEILNAMEDANTAVLRRMMQSILGPEYVEMAAELRGQMRLFIFAHVDIYEEINTVRISGANTGIGGVMANKGGIVVSLQYGTTRLAFLSAHLAAHEGESYYKARCDNIRTILNESRTYDLSSKIAPSLSSHHMFLMGDLNFRTKFKEEMTHEESVQKAMELIELKDYEALYSYDELSEGLQNGDLLLGFNTPPCIFPPTFKVEREDGITYKRQRTPSYTDRILFKSAQGLQDNLEVHAYEPCVDFITSDHKPIRGAFSITPNGVNGSQLKDADMRLVFKEMMCFDLPAADSNGFSDPYLMFLWDGIELIPEQKTFKDKLRKLVNGKSWPRTSVIEKTLNPRWDEDETVGLFANGVDIGDDAMLYIVAMDSDTIGLKDDFLGGVALHLKDLVTMEEHGDTDKIVELDKVLELGGVLSGRIKCRIEVHLKQKKHGLDFSGFFSTRKLNIEPASGPLD